jgi:hypothetical protein
VSNGSNEIKQRTRPHAFREINAEKNEAFSGADQTRTKAAFDPFDPKPNLKPKLKPKNPKYPDLLVDLPFF